MVLAFLFQHCYSQTDKVNKMTMDKTQGTPDSALDKPDK